MNIIKYGGGEFVCSIRSCLTDSAHAVGNDRELLVQSKITELIQTHRHMWLQIFLTRHTCVILFIDGQL